MPPLAIFVLLLLPADVPPFFQPPTDFYGAKGAHVTVTARANTTRVPVNRSLELTLTFRGITNLKELRPPPLHELPEFSKRFEIDRGLYEPINESGSPDGSISISYRLRPRTEEVDRIPRLRFAYYNPGAAEGKQFPVTYTDAIPIRVLPPATVAEPKSVPGVPAIFLTPSPSRGWAPPAGPGWLAGLSAGVFALAAGYVAWWRWRNPDGSRLARIRQTRAVRRVLARLDAAGEPDAVADAVLGYLVERFGLAIPSAAPCDVEAALVRAGFDDAKVAAAVGLVRRCDAARFGNGGDTPASLAAAAKALVHDWEGLPC